MNESLFNARVQECRSISDFHSFLVDYQCSSVSSLAKEFGHVLVEGGREMFAGLPQSEEHSAPVNAAFRIFSECAKAKACSWDENWGPEASRLVDALMQNEDRSFNDFLALLHMLLDSCNPQMVSHLAAIVNCGRHDLQSILEKESALDSSFYNALLALSMFHDLLSAARNSIFDVLRERNRVLDADC